MDKPSILHILSPLRHVSPFDITMAYDAGFDAVIPYGDVTLEEIPSLAQDVIFPRSPKDLRRSAILVGGRDVGVAMDMVDAARGAMVPPFDVSILADPSGAFTTAAAVVACVERQWKQRHQMELKGAQVVIFGEASLPRRGCQCRPADDRQGQGQDPAGPASLDARSGSADLSRFRSRVPRRPRVGLSTRRRRSPVKTNPRELS